MMVDFPAETGVSAKPLLLADEGARGVDPETDGVPGMIPPLSSITSFFILFLGVKLGSKTRFDVEAAIVGEGPEGKDTASPNRGVVLVAELELGWKPFNFTSLTAFGVMRRSGPIALFFFSGSLNGIEASVLSVCLFTSTPLAGKLKRGLFPYGFLSTVA